jgi:hypothetical protein
MVYFTLRYFYHRVCCFPNVNPEISGGIFDFTRGIEKFVSKSREVAPSRVYPGSVGKKSSKIWS